MVDVKISALTEDTSLAGTESVPMVDGASTKKTTAQSIADLANTYIDARAKLGKYDATVAPGVDDDVTGGYSVGSIWCDVTADDAYICLDATDGAAVWKKITYNP